MYNTMYKIKISVTMTVNYTMMILYPDYKGLTIQYYIIITNNKYSYMHITLFLMDILFLKLIRYFGND